MTPSLRCALLTFLLSPALTSAPGQNTSLPSAPLPSAPPAPSTPSAPAPQSKSGFNLPAPQYDIPTGPAPKPKEYCSGPREGIFSRHPTDPNRNKGEIQGYFKTIRSEIAPEWYRRVPRTVLGSWESGKKLTLRFAIMPDGSHTAPELTVSSGKDIYDQAALQAIRTLPLFPPPPGDLKQPLLMCMHFGYNISEDDMDSLEEPRWEKLPKKP